MVIYHGRDSKISGQHFLCEPVYLPTCVAEYHSLRDSQCLIQIAQCVQFPFLQKKQAWKLILFQVQKAMQWRVLQVFQRTFVTCLSMSTQEVWLSDKQLTEKGALSWQGSCSPDKCIVFSLFWNNSYCKNMLCNYHPTYWAVYNYLRYIWILFKYLHCWLVKILMR